MAENRIIFTKYPSAGFYPLAMLILFGGDNELGLNGDTPTASLVSQ